MKRSMLTMVVALTILLVFVAGCSEDDASPMPLDVPAPTPLPPVTSTPLLPERFQAVTGMLVNSPAGVMLWAVTATGISTQEIPAGSAVSVGRIGATMAFWDPSAGGVGLWHPRDSAKAGVISTIGIPGGPAAEAVIALSPSESLLAVVVQETPRDGAQGDGESAMRGYLVDLAFEEVTAWEWLDSVAQGYQIVKLQWSKISTAVYVSLSGGGAGQKERAYRYDAWTEKVTELTGVSTVLDNGYLDQLVGVGMPESSGARDTGGGTVDGAPLIMWRDGVSTPLPAYPGVRTRDAAWISDNGHTIVVQGTIGDGDDMAPCFEVLRRGVEGWQMDHFLVGGDALTIVQGVGFEPNSSIFCFQAGGPLGGVGGSDSGTHLCELETYHGYVLSPAMTLPGDSGDLMRALSAIVAEDCEAG